MRDRKLWHTPGELIWMACLALWIAVPFVNGCGTALAAEVREVPAVGVRSVSYGNVYEVTSSAVTEAAKNAVIVTAPDGNGSQMANCGSGVYLGDRYIATCYHVVRGTPGVGTVSFRDGVKAKFKTIATDTEFDQAILELETEHPWLPGAELSSRNPAVGESIYSAGFGNGFRIFGGPVVGYRPSETNGTTDWVVHQGAAVSGDSGGPIFEASGRLIGCLWGSTGRSTYGSCTGRFHLFAKPLFPRLAAWRSNRSGFSSSSGCVTGTCPPVTQPGISQGLGGTTQCPNGQCPLQSQNGTGTITQPSNGVITPPSSGQTPATTIGPAGPAGPAGPQGPPGVVTAEQLAQVKADVLAAIQSDDRFKGAKGDKGEPGQGVNPAALAAMIDAYLMSNPEGLEISLALVDQNGMTIDKDTVPIGGTLRLQFEAEE